ncbi:MAG: hypothetical protein R8K50_02025, partial [Mariprofundus sp.]
ALFVLIRVDLWLKACDVGLVETKTKANHESTRMNTNEDLWIFISVFICVHLWFQMVVFFFRVFRGSSL